MKMHALTFLSLAMSVGVSGVADDAAPPHGQAALFAFCHDTHDARHRSLAEQAALAKELGFDGLGHLGLESVPERLQTLDAAGLALYWLHTTVKLGADGATYDPRVSKVLPMLKGRDVLLSLNIIGGPPSDADFDPQAVPVLRQLADQAAKADVRIVLYHHMDQWLERFSDCLRVAEKVDRDNVGVMFNLCHWSRKEKASSLQPLLESAMPRLFCVAINGSDNPDELQAGRGPFIQPLGVGDFDVAGMVGFLKGLGYRGPYGLMCWGLKGDAREHLTQSMQAWRAMQAR